MKSQVNYVKNLTIIRNGIPEMAKTIEEIIIDRINRMQNGYIFTSSDFYDMVNNPTMVSRALRMLVKKGKIRKISKGRFDKPKQSILGELPPSEEWMLQEFLMDGKKIIGYMSGQYAYSRLGLSTQISSVYTIGSNTYRRAVQRGGYTIRFILQPNTINRANIPLLQILDTIRFIREIPACTPNEACVILRTNIRNLSAEDRKQLASLAMAYTSYVRAIVGAILDGIGDEADGLYQSLNPASAYKIGLTDEALPNRKKWRVL